MAWNDPKFTVGGNDIYQYKIDIQEKYRRWSVDVASSSRIKSSMVNVERPLFHNINRNANFHLFANFAYMRKYLSPRIDWVPSALHWLMRLDDRYSHSLVSNLLVLFYVCAYLHPEILSSASCPVYLLYFQHFDITGGTTEKKRYLENFLASRFDRSICFIDSIFRWFDL